MRFTLPAIVVFSLCLLTGCGGGGGGGGSAQPTPTPRPSPTSSPTPVPTVTPRLVITWGARSRGTGGLNSALSATIRLAGAKPDGSDLTFTTNRAASPGGYDATVVAPAAARQGQWAYSVTFFAEANGTGQVMGIGQTSASLGPDGNLPDVAVTGKIQRVEVAGGQNVMVGERSDLVASAFGDNNALLPMTPGSLLFSVMDGAERLRFVNGQAEGLVPGGNASVIAQADGITSAAVPVHVGSRAVVTVTPNPAKVSISATLQLSAQVSATSNQAVTWSVQEGPSGGSVSANGLYTAPATPGTYHVVATSQYDPEKNATVTITVEAGSVSVGGEFPPTGGVDIGIN